MKVAKYIGGIIGVIALIGVVFYGYMGGFRSVDIEERSFGPTTVIMATHRGSYSELGPSWERFIAETSAKGLDECDGLAFYLDAPDTPEEDLRTVLGCRVDDLEPALRARLVRDFPSFTFPESRALHGSFPYVNMLSYMLGPTKVYPAMSDMIAEEGLQPVIAIEVYGYQSSIDRIDFYMPTESSRESYQPLFDLFE